MKVRDLVARIEADGRRYVGSTGGHRHFKHPSKKGKVTVPGQMAKDVPPGTANSVLKQAGLK